MTTVQIFAPGTAQRAACVRTPRARAALIAAAVAAAVAVPLSAAPSAYATVPSCLAGPVVGVSGHNWGGYRLVASDGGVFSYGAAPFKGSMGGKTMNAKVVGMAGTPSGNGYWLAGADGGLSAFGDAQSLRDPLPSEHLNAPIVGIAAHGKAGVWLTAADGGVFALGDAPFKGSMGGRPMNKPVVSVLSSPSGNGYELIGADGGVSHLVTR